MRSSSFLPVLVLCVFGCVEQPATRGVRAELPVDSETPPVALRAIPMTREVQVSARGLTVSPIVGDSLTIGAVAIGRTTANMAMCAGSTVARSSDDSAVRDVGSCGVERFDVRGNNVEHTVTVAARPDGAGPLTVQVRVSDNYRAGRDALYRVMLTPVSFGSTFSYDGIAARDASGRALRAEIEILDDNTVALVVDDASATYPIEIDPPLGVGATPTPLDAGTPGVGASIQVAGPHAAVRMSGHGGVVGYFRERLGGWSPVTSVAGAPDETAAAFARGGALGGPRLALSRFDRDAGEVATTVDVYEGFARGSSTTPPVRLRLESDWDDNAIRRLDLHRDRLLVFVNASSGSYAMVFEKSSIGMWNWFAGNIFESPCLSSSMVPLEPVDVALGDGVAADSVSIAVACGNGSIRAVDLARDATPGASAWRTLVMPGPITSVDVEIVGPRIVGRVGSEISIWSTAALGGAPAFTFSTGTTTYDMAADSRYVLVVRQSPDTVSSNVFSLYDVFSPTPSDVVWTSGAPANVSMVALDMPFIGYLDPRGATIIELGAFDLMCATTDATATCAPGSVCEPNADRCCLVECGPCERCDARRVACSAIPGCDAGVPDSGVVDTGVGDSGTNVADAADSGVPDSGVGDASPDDTGAPTDSGIDTGATGVDTGVLDTRGTVLVRPGVGYSGGGGCSVTAPRTSQVPLLLLILAVFSVVPRRRSR